MIPVLFRSGISAQQISWNLLPHQAPHVGHMQLIIFRRMNQFVPTHRNNIRIHQFCIVTSIPNGFWSDNIPSCLDIRGRVYKVNRHCCISHAERLHRFCEKKSYLEYKDIYIVF